MRQLCAAGASVLDALRRPNSGIVPNSCGCAFMSLQTGLRLRELIRLFARKPGRLESLGLIDKGSGHGGHRLLHLCRPGKGPRLQIGEHGRVPGLEIGMFGRILVEIVEIFERAVAHEFPRIG